MDQDALLALYDREQRREIEYHDADRQELPRIVRHRSRTGEDSFVLHSSLNRQTVDDEIEAQIAYFEGVGSNFEWKVFDYDSPSDLCERLAARGFEIDDPEAVMVLDLDTAPQALFDPTTADIARIEVAADVNAVAIVEERVWQRDFSELAARLKRDLRDVPDGIDIYVSYVDGEPASAAWSYYHAGTSFASLWGGSTIERYRGRGLYSALLGIRAAEARRRGYRFLTVDASPMSQPILKKYGFMTITNARACTWHVRSSV